MRDETYNGWTNYETWLVNVWIDNSQGDQEYWQEQSRIAVDSTASEYCPDGAAIRWVAEEMRAWVEEAAAEFRTEGMIADLLNASISSVNWDELARHYINAAKEEVKQ